MLPHNPGSRHPAHNPHQQNLSHINTTHQPVLRKTVMNPIIRLRLVLTVRVNSHTRQPTSAFCATGLARSPIIMQIQCLLE